MYGYIVKKVDASVDRAALESDAQALQERRKAVASAVGGDDDA